MLKLERVSLYGALLLSLCGVVQSDPTTTVRARSPATTAQVRSLIEAGRYGDAEAAARLLVSAATTEAGAESLETAQAIDLLVAALLRNGKGAQPDTRALAESACRIKDGQLRPDDVELSRSLRNLASTLIEVGDAQQSIPLFERARTIEERARGPDAPETAEALDDLGHAQVQSGRYDDAQRSLDRALSINERRLEPSDRASAKSPSTVAGVARLFRRLAISGWSGLRALCPIPRPRR